MCRFVEKLKCEYLGQIKKKNRNNLDANTKKEILHIRLLMFAPSKKDIRPASCFVINFPQIILTCHLHAVGPCSFCSVQCCHREPFLRSIHFPLE